MSVGITQGRGLCASVKCHLVRCHLHGWCDGAPGQPRTRLGRKVARCSTGGEGPGEACGGPSGPGKVGDTESLGESRDTPKSFRGDPPPRPRARGKEKPLHTGPLGLGLGGWGWAVCEPSVPRCRLCGRASRATAARGLLVGVGLQGQGLLSEASLAWGLLGASSGVTLGHFPAAPCLLEPGVGGNSMLWGSLVSQDTPAGGSRPPGPGPSYLVPNQGPGLSKAAWHNPGPGALPRRAAVALGRQER